MALQNAGFGVQYTQLNDTYIHKYIHDSTLLLEGNACSYKQDALDRYILVVDGKFETGI